jgi:hypothetical protein
VPLFWNIGFVRLKSMSPTITKVICKLNSISRFMVHFNIIFNWMICDISCIKEKELLSSENVKKHSRINESRIRLNYSKC